jgi:lysophospholipase L1-like esterase
MYHSLKKNLLLYLLIQGIVFPFYGENKTTYLLEVPVPEFDFLHYEYNEIQIPGRDSSRIREFYRKIDRLLKDGEGQINVLHIGGSHIQADMLTHQVRLNLESINSQFQTPRGFIFPFSVARTNNPSNYRVSYTGNWDAARNVQHNREISLGMSGIAVYTSDSNASISVSLNNKDESMRWTFDRLRLLAYTGDENQSVLPVLSFKNQVIEPDLDTLSNTYVFTIPTPTDSFRINFLQQDTVPHTMIVTGFIAEKNVPGIVYHSIGVNGASVPSYLGSEFLEDELPLIAPDLVVFEIGINDAFSKDFTFESFVRNYNSLIEIIKRVNPDCAFIFITNNDSFRKINRKRYEVNRNGLIAQEAFYELAKENQGGLWDLFSLMGGLKSMQKWQEKGLAQGDKVHFTKAGYELLGNLFYNALIKFYLQNDIE